MLEHLLTQEQKALREEVRDFVKSIPRELILKMDRDEVKFPREFLREAGRRRLMGVRYPSKWGGRDMDWVSTCMVMEEIGTLGYIFACVFGVSGELVADAIILHGTDEQKERYALPLLKGDLCAAECLTEPRGGSDFFGTTTTAEEKGDYFVLRGQKRFIVGGDGADFFLVYARTSDDPNPKKAISCFIVERGPGVETKYHYGLMGCRGGGTSRLLFDNVKVPKGNILGRLNCGYEVFKTMMIPERLGTAAMTIGAARPAFEISSAYTTRRKAFGRRIMEFQGVSFQVAESAMLLDAARALVYSTAKAVDQKAPEGYTRRLISETKKFVTEACQKVVHNSMQVMGGIGYTNIFPIERIMRDLRLASIWTGTNEIMASVIAHEWYQELEHIKSTRAREHELDAQEAYREEEKVYE